jgi:NO-binding membrane sensor protein with MHYT domain
MEEPADVAVAVAVAPTGSLTLWLLASAVALASTFVAHGWLRRVQRTPEPRKAWGGQLLAGLVMGTGICASFLVELASQGLPFAIGYKTSAAAVLWAQAVGGCVLGFALLVRFPGWSANIGAGVFVAATALGVQTGWVQAAGFRPGVQWNAALLWAAGIVMVIGLVCAYGLAHLKRALNNAGRRGGRIAASVVAALALVAGQELVVTGARLGAQASALHAQQLPAPTMTLLSGALVPVILLVLGADLFLRREIKRHRSRDAGASLSDDRPRRHKKRHRIRNF